MNSSGHYALFDCILGFIVIIVFLSTLKAPEMNHFTELAIAQKTHDLLTVWQAKKTFSAEELRKDFRLAFGEKNGEIIVGEKKIPVGNPRGAKAFSSETFFLDENMEPARLRVTVFD
ncbi:MAG: hypothetical protein Q7K34_03790 [archaeon]|nr:hypothetical protein [archaeon]